MYLDKKTHLGKRQQALVFLSLITLMGAALRLYHLDFQSLWYDELHSIIPTDPDNSLQAVIDYSKTDQPPAFFIYLLYFFKVFGYSEVAGRTAAAVLGIVSIPLMFLLGKEIKGTSAGLFAAGLTSLNYMHVYYSQELRFYSMLFLLTCLSFLFLVRAFKHVRSTDFILYVVFTIALLYTHYYGLFIFATQMLTFLVLLFFKRDKQFILLSLTSGLLVAVAFVPWIPVILADLGIESFWIRTPGPMFIIEYFYYYFGKDILATALLVYCIFLFVRHFSKTRGGDATPVYVILVCWLILSYLLPYIRSVVGTPILYVRYTIISLPAWILIASAGLDTIVSKKWRLTMVSVLSLSMLMNIVFFRKHYTKVDKQQIREASNFVKIHNAGHPIYSPYAWQFGFYFRNDSIKPQPVDLDSMSSDSSFWLLQAEFFSPNETEELLDSFAGEFEIVERVAFHKTEAVLLKRVDK